MTPKDFLKNSPLPSLHPEGYPFVSLIALATILLGLLWVHLFWIGVFIVIFSIFHFRRPKRVSPEAVRNLVAPTDGIITSIEMAPLPDGFNSDSTSQLRIRIRGGLLDSQIVHAPISGVITFEKYDKVPLFSDVANDERGETVFFTFSGQAQTIKLCIHAPILGKKLLDSTRSGQEITLGSEIGVSRFINITDIYLPENTEVILAKGQRVIAGESLLATFSLEKLNENPV